MADEAANQLALRWFRALPAAAEVRWEAWKDLSAEHPYCSGSIDAGQPQAQRFLGWSWIWTIFGPDVDWTVDEFGLQLPYDSTFADGTPCWSADGVSRGLEGWARDVLGRADLRFVFDPALHSTERDRLGAIFAAATSGEGGGSVEIAPGVTATESVAAELAEMDPETAAPYLAMISDYAESRESGSPGTLLAVPIPIPPAPPESPARPSAPAMSLTELQDVVLRFWPQAEAIPEGAHCLIEIPGLEGVPAIFFAGWEPDEITLHLVERSEVPAHAWHRVDALCEGWNLLHPGYTAMLHADRSQGTAGVHVQTDLPTDLGAVEVEAAIAAFPALAGDLIGELVRAFGGSDPDG